MASDSNMIIGELYPLVSSKLDVNNKKLLRYISEFMNKRHNEIHAVAPYTRILYNVDDERKLYISVDITEKEIENILKKTFFWNKDVRPKCIKEPYVQLLMCSIKYFMNNNDQKNAELTTIYLLLTGKFYASLHSTYWKYGVQENVMDYVVNNMLSDKFDLKREGTIFKSLQKMANTYLSKYEDIIKADDLSDDDFKLLIQQLRDRLNSFLKNISIAYYEAIENKSYMNYETDNVGEDEYRLTNNDANTAARLTEAAIGIMTSQKVSLAICNSCKNENVKALEVQDIMETILSQKENIPKMRRVINILICDFMANNPGKRVGGADFISYSLAAKPNSKNKLYLEMKTTILTFLDENSPAYRKRKSRIATANNYYRSILTYIVLIICKVTVS